MANIFVLWYGGINYSHSELNDVELFDSLTAAKDALRDRAQNGHWYPQHFNFVHKPAQDALTPCADEGAYIDIYYTDPSESDNGIARRFVLGPRGGISEDRC